MNFFSSTQTNKPSYKKDRRKKDHTKPFKRRENTAAKTKQADALDHRLFVKKAVPKEQVHYLPSREIGDLPLDNRLKANLIKKGYTHPTEIQDKTLEALLQGRDLLGIAQTGTGKTGAFLTPLINRLIGTKPAFQVLVVVPTRELAVQIEQEFKSITKGLNLYSACFIGGTSLGKDLAILRRSTHVVIGTPGRLTDLSRQGALHFSRFTTLVLDEFDRLLDMGFKRDIQYISQAMTTREQTALFSATEAKSQRPLIQELLTDPFEIRVSSGNTTGDHIDQEIVKVGSGENKTEILIRMIRDESFQKGIVFAETKRGVNLLCKKLQEAGVKADMIHGNKTQNYRLKVLNDFKTGKIRVLIATDVAARGLDILEVSHVINYQQPKNFDSYIHRIGRTGRAGKAGKAYTFVN